MKRKRKNTNIHPQENKRVKIDNSNYNSSVNLSREDNDKINNIKSKEKQSNNKEYICKCAICLCDIKIPGILDGCNHKFCFECIYKWSNVNNTCPLCREEINVIKKKESNGKIKRFNIEHNKKVTLEISHRNALILVIALEMIRDSFFE